MYTIIKKDDLFYCKCRIQDGTESWNEDTLEEAITGMICAAKAYNHSTITERDIEFSPKALRKQVVSTKKSNIKKIKLELLDSMDKVKELINKLESELENK